MAAEQLLFFLGRICQTFEAALGVEETKKNWCWRHCVSGAIWTPLEAWLMNSIGTFCFHPSVKIAAWSQYYSWPSCKPNLRFSLLYKKSLFTKNDFFENSQSGSLGSLIVETSYFCYPTWARNSYRFARSSKFFAHLKIVEIFFSVFLLRYAGWRHVIALRD